MHEEARKVAVANNKLKGDLRWHTTKLASIQSELNDLKQENEKLVSSYKATGCVCASSSTKVDQTKVLQEEYDKFKKDHFEKCTVLQYEISYLKDLIKKVYQGKCNLNQMLSVQKYANDKTGLGYNKQTKPFQNEKFAPSKKVNPKRVSKKKHKMTQTNHNPHVVTCHYCMKKGHKSHKCYVRRFDVPRGKCVWIPKEKETVTNPMDPSSIGYLPSQLDLYFASVPKCQKFTMVLR